LASAHAGNQHKTNKSLDYKQSTEVWHQMWMQSLATLAAGLKLNNRPENYQIEFYAKEKIS
jgi:hypothetical protein